MPTKDFIEKMRVRLEEEKIRLGRDMTDVGGIKDAETPGHFEAEKPEYGGNSDDDNAMEITNYADEISIVAKLETELRDTIKALESIAKGTYGVCKYCKKEIDLKRLEARPTSSTCISCKKTLTQEM